MRKMANRTGLMMALLLLVAPCAFADYSVTLYQNGYSYGVGGEFTAADPSLNGFLSNYSPYTKLSSPSGLGFETFCMEYGEEFSPGTKYNVALNTKAMNGGVGPEGDPISIGTAFLYSQFATGSLAQYDFTNSQGKRQSNAGDLQLAFWWLEGEYGSYNPNNTFEKMVVDKFGSEAGAMADANGAYGVMVMNLTDDLGGHHQDQLVMVPEPATLLLLGLGIFGVGVTRKFSK